MKKRNAKPKPTKLKRVDCNLTAEMVAVLKAYMKRLAARKKTDPEVDAPHGIGAVIEALLRTHPEIETEREAEGVNWKPRPIKGKRKKRS